MINDNEFKASINDEMLNDYGNIKTELINAFHIFMILIVFLYYYVINRKYKEYKWGNKK